MMDSLNRRFDLHCCTIQTTETLVYLMSVLHIVTERYSHLIVIAIKHTLVLRSQLRLPSKVSIIGIEIKFLKDIYIYIYTYRHISSLIMSKTHTHTQTFQNNLTHKLFQGGGVPFSILLTYSLCVCGGGGGVMILHLEIFLNTVLFAF